MPVRAVPRFDPFRRAPRALGGAFVLVAVLLAGCGGAAKKSAQVDPGTYVSQVCTSVGAWQRSIADGSSELDRRLRSARNAAEAKRALEELVSGWVVNSEHVVASLRAAGVPAVKDGETISSALVSTFDKASADLRALEGEVSNLPTGGAELRTAATKLSSSLQSSLAGIGSGLEGLRSEELRKAAEQSASCRSLATSST